MYIGTFTTGVGLVDGKASCGQSGLSQRKLPCCNSSQRPFTQQKLQSNILVPDLASLRQSALTTSRNRFFTPLVVKADANDQQVGTDRGSPSGDAAWRQTTVIQNR
jgi:hypothetical protein